MYSISVKKGGFYDPCPHPHPHPQGKVEVAFVWRPTSPLQICLCLQGRLIPVAGAGGGTVVDFVLRCVFCLHTSKPAVRHLPPTDTAPVSRKCAEVWRFSLLSLTRYFSFCILERIWHPSDKALMSLGPTSNLWLFRLCFFPASY